MAMLSAEILKFALPFTGEGENDWTRFILDEAEVAINYCTADHVIAYANKKHAALHGLTQDKVIGQPIINILGREAYEKSLPFYARALRGEKFMFEMEANFLIGPRYIQCHYTPVFDETGKAKGWVGVIIDMTQRHRLEKELLQEKERAEAATAAKSEFLANMSHELRTPMNAVIGLLNIMLTRNITPEKQKEYLRVMQVSAQQLLGLINDLLDVTRLEAGQTPLETIRFSLDEVLSDVVAINAVQARQKSIGLHIEKHDLPEVALIGDPLRLRQVLLNLVGNAIKFTDTGEVRIIAEGLGVSNGQQALRIHVRDTGIGIAPENQEAIFQQFTQADSSISRTHGGTGLGLYISKLLLNMMGGTVALHSHAGEGATFTIELSLPLGAVAESITPISSAGGLIAKKMRILIVEDNDANLMVASSLLEMEGHDFETARNGKEALAKLQSGIFDIVLMDLQMPEIDGLEATRQLREMEKVAGRAHTPVIGLTAHALSGDRERCLSAGMNGYLSKPFEIGALIDTLAKYQ